MLVHKFITPEEVRNEGGNVIFKLFAFVCLFMTKLSILINKIVFIPPEVCHD